MKKDLPAVIRRTASFLDKNITEPDVQKLADHLNFNNMKNNKAVNKEKFEELSKYIKKIIY